MRGRFDATTGHYRDRKTWLEAVGRKYGEQFMVRLNQLLPPPSEDQDIAVAIEIAMLDQVIAELKPLLSQAAIKDHIEWNYPRNGKMIALFMDAVWEERTPENKLYYTPEAALELLEAIRRSSSEERRVRDGKYRPLYEFNQAFDGVYKVVNGTLVLVKE